MSNDTPIGRIFNLTVKASECRKYQQRNPADVHFKGERVFFRGLLIGYVRGVTLPDEELRRRRIQSPHIIQGEPNTVYGSRREATIELLKRVGVTYLANE